MKRRLVVLTEIISPYRIPLFNALARNQDVDLHVIFLAETDPSLRQWRVYKDEIHFSHEVLPSWRRNVGGLNFLLNRGVLRALSAASPEAILCGGYNYVASWQALMWAGAHSVRFLLWSESNLHELRRGHPMVEFLKSEFIGRCDAFVVPGQWASEYLRAHKIREDQIFIAPNAVDNDLFASAAANARQNSAANRRELNLPDRYFLFVGRLVREKGVFELLSAYAKLDGNLRQQVGLVFVGDGVCREQLQQQAASITTGPVRFAGFAHREQLATYYALADMLILPTFTDTWGLVVNEAMACGLPVILSRAAGCGPDLVRENWNGLLVLPREVCALASAMSRLACRPDLCITMGAHSVDLISHFSPAVWANSIARALQATTGAHD
jgi:glycosyltransferase involved in cell wall biosynthesis